MSHAEVVAMLNQLGLPYAIHHFAEGESRAPPFICFLYTGAESFGADNIVYTLSPILEIEVYTDKKDPELEARLHRLLTDHELYYTKTEVWIASEKLYEVVYTTVL